MPLLTLMIQHSTLRQGISNLKRNLNPHPKSIVVGGPVLLQERLEEPGHILEKLPSHKSHKVVNRLQRQTLLSHQMQTLVTFLVVSTCLVHFSNPDFWVPAVLLDHSEDLPIFQHLCFSLGQEIHVSKRRPKLTQINPPLQCLEHGSPLTFLRVLT